MTQIVTQTLARLGISLAAALLLLVFTNGLATAANIVGNTQKWQPLNLDFIGPNANENDTSPNPFLDLRLTVSLTSPSGRTLTLPGFFAGDGNGQGTGNIWRARFAADETGTWQYRAELRSGNNIAISTDANAGNVVSLDGSSGSFSITQHNGDAPGFLKWGRLNYEGGHYLKFADGPYWIKSGTDSPENFLGYAGIDGTIDAGGIENNFLHTFSTHRDQWRSGDPLFTNSRTGADSLGIIGALNYLADRGVNSIYFLPMNLGGDGQETYPFVGYQKTTFNKTHYDISKLHQWNTVLAHAQSRGIALNIVLSETERANERWLDEGQLGTERKLFFRELIARYGYLLAVKWNLGEENDYPVSELKKHADYIRLLDWSNKPVAVHTQINNFRDYEELVGHGSFSASSIQYDPPFAGEFVETWRKRSTDAGRPWIIDMDENTGGVINNNASIRRKQILYDVYFSGGNIEWYFGYYALPIGGDVTAGDFTRRSDIWRYTRYAREFMERELPFWRMEPADNLVTNESTDNGGAEVFAAFNDTYAVYLPNAANTATINLSGANNSFTLRWFDPSSGQFAGGSQRIEGGGQVSLGNPPSRRNDDWVALLQSDTNQESLVVADVADPPTVIEDVAQQTPEVVQLPASITDNNSPYFSGAWQFDATTGELFRFSMTARDDDGVAPIISAATLPPGMRFESVTNGVATLVWQIPLDSAGTQTFALTATDVDDRSVVVTRTVEINVTQVVETNVTQPVDAEVVTNVQTLQPAPVPNSLGTDKPPTILGAENRQVMVGERLSQTIVPIDPEGIVPAIRAVSLPSGASFTDNGNGTRTLNWVPTPDDRGFHEIRLIATDAGDIPFVTQAAMRIEVIDQTIETAPLFQDDTGGSRQNFPPVLSVTDNNSIKLGETFIYRIKPVDPEGIAPILHLLVQPEGSTFDDNGDGSRTFIWMPTAAGEYQFIVVATDSVDGSLSTEVPLNLTVLE